MRYVVRTALSLAGLASLSACGLTGDLDRPPPVFSDPPSDEARMPVAAPALYASKDIRDVTYTNPLGGEIPKPAPSIDVEEDEWDETVEAAGPG